MQFADHFSAQAQDYAKFRPTYPASFFDWLARQSPEAGTAWDCGTGNGQAALQLAGLFDQVIATDPSEAQLAQAPAHPKVRYVQAAAEQVPIDDRSIDLITVAQALHWFDFDAFYAEVRRVAKQGAVLAAWTYQLPVISPEVDEAFRHFYKEITDAWWPAERHYIDEAYETIPFPFERLEVPPFQMRLTWELKHLFGYLSTWSASKRYEKANGHSPLDHIHASMTAAWGEPEAPKEVVWDLIVLAGRV